MTLTEPWVQRWQWLRCVAGCRICLGLHPTGERLAQRGAGNATIALPPQRRVQQRDRVALCRIIEQRIQRLSRSEEHTSELQSLMRNSYAVFCLKKKKNDLQDLKITSLTYNHTTINNTNHKLR